MAITCNAVATGKVGRRYLCTDGVRSWLAGTEYRYNGKLAREVYPTNALDSKPADGVILHGGWGGNQDANTWSITKMRDNPELFKIVDDTGKNIMTDYKTQLDAQKSIDYRLFVETDTGSPEPPAPAPSPQPAPAPSPPQTGVVKGPYPAIGPEMGHTIRGPTTRHYASGKPDDETIEANIRGIKHRNHQFIVYVTVSGIEHDDNVSLKLGGTHMGTGWFDNGVSFEDGQTCLGVEPEHPSTKTCVVRGPKVGSILNKKVGICCTYYADQNHTELFTDMGDGQGWKKQVEGANIGGFNAKASEFECQCRIDGFTKGSVPVFHAAVVQPIAGRST